MNRPYRSSSGTFRTLPLFPGARSGVLHLLTSHNQTLVPTWLPTPSDGIRIAGLAASPAGVRTNLATRRPHTQLRCEYIGK